MYLQHVDRSRETGDWAQCLALADGTAGHCRTETGPKGIPVATVLSTEDNDNIDLLPILVVDRTLAHPHLGTKGSR